MNKKSLTLVVMVLAAMVARAYDFSVAIDRGANLYCTIIDASQKTVKIVSPNVSSTDPYKGLQQPSGQLNIPATVRYNDITYSVVAIGDRAFSSCLDITGVVIPNTVTSIGNYAFYQCVGISSPIVIGEKIVSIGTSAFFGCSNVPEVIFKAIDCKQMGGSTSSSVFGNCASLTKLTIGPLVQTIPDYAFCGADNLNSPLVLPHGLEKIGSFAFAFCTSLKGELVIPEGVKSIGECAFHQCHSLTKLKIPSSVTSIGQRAFYQCFGFTTISIEATVPPTIFPSTFSNISQTTPIEIPCISLKLYKSAPEWSHLSNFQAVGECDFKVVGILSDELAGEVIGSGRYSYNDTAMLMVICHQGFGFNGWSDGNEDNPRKIIVTKSMEVEALMQPANTVYVRDTVQKVDTVYRDGVKVIHDTIDLMDVVTPISAVPLFTNDVQRQRIAFNIDKKKIDRVDIYNELGNCVFSSNKPRRNYISTSDLATGSYILKVVTKDKIYRMRFFHSSKKTK